MTYVTVQVPEQHLTAVYELLLARAGRQTDVPAAPVAHDRPAQDEVHEQSIARVYGLVTDEGRDALNALAESPSEPNFDFETFEAAAGVPNLGAALQSIAIQSARAGGCLARGEEKAQGRL